LPEPPPAAIPRIRGQIFQARLAYLRERYGPQGTAAVRAALPEEERKILESVHRQGWYPLRTLLALDRVIGASLAPDDPDIYEHLGAASARHRTEWLGEQARLMSVHGFLSRVAEEHRRFHDFGHAVYRRIGFTKGELSFSEYPEFDDVYCLSARGYLRSAVEFMTGGGALVDEKSCQCRGDAACVFALSWSSEAPAEKRPS